MHLISLKPLPERYCETKASVLILVLVVITSMTILAVGMAYRTRIGIKLAGASARRTQAYYLALGGIERVLALIDGTDPEAAAVARISGFSSSAQEEGLLEQITANETSHQSHPLGLSYAVRDEQACLNLNKSDAGCWQQIPGIDAAWAAAVIDFTDQDNDTSPDGAESNFYLSLERAHAAKNKLLIALKELIYVRGTTLSLYLGEDLNRNLLLDENETDGAEQPPADNEDNKLDLGLVDVFTVHGEGRININTASKTVLAALPGLDEQVADAVITHRCGPDGIVRTEDDILMTDANDLTSVTQATELQVELLQQYCCFSSQYLRVFSTASVEGGHTCSLMATVRINPQKPEIVCLERLL